MSRSKNNETRATKAIKMINAMGATWEEVGRVLNLNPNTIRAIVKAHYKSEKAYNNLLAKARANKKAKEEVKKIIEDDILVEEIEEESKKEQEEVIVVETGYLLDAGISALLAQSLDVYMPFFCIGELEKLSNSYAVAEELLTMYWSTRQITSINMRGKEELYEEPIIPVKDRSKGVVSLCVELDSLGYRVRLLTNSREIEDLAKLQGCNINVVRIKKAR